MKVILTENIDKLGKMGDTISVKDGYARNYIFPKRKAREATPENMKVLEKLKKKSAEKENRKLGEIQKLADRISGLSITISAQAGEEEKLYGSVTNDMIADAVKAEGIDIDKKDIILEEPIKKLGVYQVTVKLHPEIKASLRVWVVKN